jgi:hypothetical protein
MAVPDEAIPLEQRTDQMLVDAVSSLGDGTLPGIHLQPAGKDSFRKARTCIQSVIRVHEHVSDAQDG